jgi:hypothetical protein
LRSIDRFVDLGELRRELVPFYSTIERHVPTDHLLRSIDRFVHHPKWRRRRVNRSAINLGAPRLPSTAPIRPAQSLPWGQQRSIDDVCDESA